MKKHNIKSKKECSKGTQRAREIPFSFIRLNNYLLAKVLLVPLTSPLLQKSVQFCTYILRHLLLATSQKLQPLCARTFCGNALLSKQVYAFMYDSRKTLSSFTQKKQTLHCIYQQVEVLLDLEVLLRIFCFFCHDIQNVFISVQTFAAVNHVYVRAKQSHHYS